MGTTEESTRRHGAELADGEGGVDVCRGEHAPGEVGELTAIFLPVSPVTEGGTLGL
jgi:hypothetical protein